MNVIVNKVGGNASPKSRNYKISIPTAWAQAMGIDPENRRVTMSFDSEHQQITIRPAAEEDLTFVVDSIEVKPAKVYNTI